MNGIGTASEVAPQIVDVRGRRIHVLRRGEGPPVIYLHSATGETWWTDLDEALAAAGFDVVHPAHPGYETSEGLDEIDDIHDLAFHTLDLLDALGLDRVSVVGSSMGGWLAAESAVYASERITKLILVDPAGLAPPSADMWALRPPQLAELLFADQDHWMAQLMHAIDLETSMPPSEILVPLLQSMAAAARVGWNPHLYDPKLAGRLHHVRAPTLVVWGEQDGFIPPDTAERWGELIRGSRISTIADCGHLPVLERPDELAAQALAFLRS